MNHALPLPLRSKQPALASLLSLIMPGAGQAYLVNLPLGAAILTTTLVMGYIIYWAFDNFLIGAFTIAGLTTSWFWFLLAAFWAWNVFDAYRRSQHQPTLNGIGLLLPALILYIIAWQVTDVKLDRLITRFDDAKVVASAIFHPDLFTTDAEGHLVPSENFDRIVGTIEPAPAPQILVNLRLAAPDATIPLPVPGAIFQTIALGLMATFLSIFIAIPISFLGAHNIMSRLPGGTVIYYVARAVFNIMRSIDTLIWGLLIVVWVGLGPFAGMLALAIHSIAALAKLYSEEIEHIDTGPIEAITATGANLLQVVRYAVIPQIIPPFLAYTLLRWDINMRSATVVGFVAGGGIGFFVVETIRKSGYEQYAAALWIVAFVIIVVDYVSAYWRERVLVGETVHVKPALGRGEALLGDSTIAGDAKVDEPKMTVASPTPFYKSPRTLFYLVLALLVLYYSARLTEIDLRKLFAPGPTFLQVVSDFLHLDLTPDVIQIVIKNLLQTTFQALIATTFGGILAIPYSFLAARNLMGGSRLSLGIYYVARFILNFLRSIEALLYVAIFVFWVGVGAFAGALALAVTTFALIGKLFSEAIENIEPGAMEAITATGASRLQTIMYAVLPQIVPPFVSYSIYQWDINIRIATVIGLAGGGGIGLLFFSYANLLQYHKAGTVIAAIVIIVTLMDFASAKVREKLI
jgi:phosphonate ABC transporter permease subunit PhnE